MDLGEALELREELVKEHARKDEGVFERIDKRHSEKTAVAGLGLVLKL
jgi:hypothetical protein